MSRKREPYKRVKAFLVENGIGHENLADLLKLKSNTITKKLNGLGGDFTLNEVSVLNKELGIPIVLFFEPNVPLKELNKTDKRCMGGKEQADE